MPINQEVTATFSEAMDPATITGSTFTVIGPGLTPVTGNVSYDAANGIAIFAPTGTFSEHRIHCDDYDGGQESGGRSAGG